MQLIYLSPVSWGSFSQRPHKFVEWFHSTTGGNVLWIDPYLTRFPALTDFHHLRYLRAEKHAVQPHWISLIKPVALPVEPLPGSRWANAPIWKHLLDALEAFSRQQETLLVIGKPSALALAALERLAGCRSVYDAMDDFPHFYSGLARMATRRREQQIAHMVTVILASSTALKRRWEQFRPDVSLAHNGVDASMLPAPRATSITKETKVLGYMGTIAAWFDWEWVTALAMARPTDEVRLIGPIFKRAPIVPDNVKILQPLDHRSAMEAVRDFDVGLIPFKRNGLTASVDPIKYYEYRALGLPVIATDFGEMALRGGEEGVLLSTSLMDIPDLVIKALCSRPDGEKSRQFALRHTWEASFSAARIIQ